MGRIAAVAFEGPKVALKFTIAAGSLLKLGAIEKIYWSGSKSAIWRGIDRDMLVEAGRRTTLNGQRFEDAITSFKREWNGRDPLPEAAMK